MGRNKYKKMTEKEIIIGILERIGKKIYYDDGSHIEFHNGFGYENLIIEFDDIGNVTNIGC